MQAGFNIANAMGAFLGGIPLEYGYPSTIHRWWSRDDLYRIGYKRKIYVPVRLKTQNEEEIAAECVSCDK